jgi:hypothetical protein
LSPAGGEGSSIGFQPMFPAKFIGKDADATSRAFVFVQIGSCDFQTQ